jgi:hypothetical protein
VALERRQHEELQRRIVERTHAAVNEFAIDHRAVARRNLDLLGVEIVGAAVLARTT